MNGRDLARFEKMPEMSCRRSRAPRDRPHATGLARQLDLLQSATAARAELSGEPGRKAVGRDIPGWRDIAGAERHAGGQPDRNFPARAGRVATPPCCRRATTCCRSSRARIHTAPSRASPCDAPRRRQSPFRAARSRTASAKGPPPGTTTMRPAQAAIAVDPAPQIERRGAASADLDDCRPVAAAHSVGDFRIALSRRGVELMHLRDLGRALAHDLDADRAGADVELLDPDRDADDPADGSERAQRSAPRASRPARYAPARRSCGCCR